MTRPLMSPISSPSSCGGMSDEEFNIFHAIDRILYSRLVLNLGRQPAESMQVMGLWLWLEREAHHSHLVKQLISIPASLLNSVADETLACLKCIDGSFDPHNYENDIPLLKKVLGNKNSASNKIISLRYFYENRIGVLRGVATIVSEVCVRAFQDIWRWSGAGNRRLLVIEEGGGEEEINGELVLLPSDDDDIWKDRIGDPNQIVQSITCNGHLATQSQLLDDVPLDERTIFLTFSKGYPLSYLEVRHFFTRKFGEIIEAIYMQEVGINEQSLYARLVLLSVSAIDFVLDGQSKAKFTINGKHLWARKYLRKKKIKDL